MVRLSSIVFYFGERDAHGRAEPAELGGNLGDPGPRRRSGRLALERLGEGGVLLAESFHEEAALGLGARLMEVLEMALDAREDPRLLEVDDGEWSALNLAEAGGRSSDPCPPVGARAACARVPNALVATSFAIRARVPTTRSAVNGVRNSRRGPCATRNVSAPSVAKRVDGGAAQSIAALVLARSSITPKAREARARTP